MYRYAQLDSNNKVIAISYLHNEETVENLVLTNDLAVVEGSIYDKNTHIFTIPELAPNTASEPTIEEQILAETQYQTALLEVNSLGGNV